MNPNARYHPSMLAAMVLAAALVPKHIVLVAGDEEYRSEEMLPQLAEVLSKRHGFRCTVVLPHNDKGEVDPAGQTPSPSLAVLKDADLVVLMTRFRNWPDTEMSWFDGYVRSKRPIIGIRTATHAFATTGTFARYAWNNSEWPGGFGRQVLGETWVAHHGKHLEESTLATATKESAGHPVLRGVGKIWVPSDVYVAKPEGVEVLMEGAVLDGMKRSSKPLDDPRNHPKMPVAWVKVQGGRRVFTTTMGSGLDLLDGGFRRLLVNASYWCMDLRVPRKADVRLVGTFQPYPIGFGKTQEPGTDHGKSGRRRFEAGKK